MHKLGEADLLQGCRKNDREAYKEVYERYGKSLYLYGLRLLNSKEDADDALQQTFMRFYKSIPKFKGTSSIKTYIFRIMINVCNDMLSKSMRLQAFPSAEDNDLYDRSQPDFQLRFQLEAAIKQLPEKMRECFVLHYIEGFKIQEIAQLNTLAVGTIKAHLHSAREKLKEMV